jgi:hypothetical protein
MPASLFSQHPVTYNARFPIYGQVAQSGETETEKGPVGEAVEDKGPVDLCPAERPSHGGLGPVPQRSRDCVAYGFSRRMTGPVLVMTHSHAMDGIYLFVTAR